MEDQCSPLSWGYFYQEEGMEELKHTLLFKTLELETTLISAKEEITRREFELIHLKDVLSRTKKERDEARARCQKLVLEKFILEQQLQQKEQQQQKQQQQKVQEQQQETASLSGVSSSEDESKPGDSNKHISSPDSNRSMISSPGLDSVSPTVNLPLQPQPSLPQEALKLAANRPLPEKGKLLQAVKDAGPLLQNLILAGPLPQWQHPPPQLTSIDIPPVAISSPSQQLINQDSFNNFTGCLSKKRGPENYEGSDSSPNTKYQKVVLH
ncbi:putative uncharacterized protein DDB_G0272516 [Durio zibethinus]|uniref:Uncharacterized protein n=1 Tax=Durio zibethinus TaxID=66656 RepID=A0A6P6AI84_DURZI|nr:putative uncharacterized protein DDB_G0272516 [Durio zibethinus]